MKQGSGTIRGDRKIGAAQGQEGAEQNNCFWTGQGSCVHEPPEAMVACTPPAQHQASSPPAGNWKGL